MKKINEKDLAGKGLAYCPVPECRRVFKPTEEQKMNPPKKLPICPECEKFLIKLMFFLPKIRIHQGVTPQGLVVPGSPQFKMEAKNEKSLRKP